MDKTLSARAAKVLEDFLNRGSRELSPRKYMLLSKGAVVFWVGVCMGASFLFGGSKSPVIEIINAIGSAFYGPVLVTFLLIQIFSFTLPTLYR